MRPTLTLAVLAAVLATAITGAASAAPATGPTASDATVATVATLTVRNTRFGRILFDGRGRVLYAFTRDRRGGPSRCYGDCAAAWPVYYAKGKLQAAAGGKQALLRTTRRR